jgi:hypothetical protein
VNPIAVRSVIVALKVVLALSTFFIYPVIFPWSWRAARWVSQESITRREAARYAARQAGRRRYEQQQRRGG